ncbi:MAG: nucleoside deaminase [Salinibacter sp.]|uniref:nucleoside deaminase n=1 Tax=Salinibacter sp. TaxID=2065818 RepID=UPI0035D507C4
MSDVSSALDHERFVRAAIEEAVSARDAGNPPFGAVLVAPDGTVLERAGNTEARTGDCTGHAETNLVRVASQQYGADRLRNATLYASTEPCAMCAGAVFWARIGRVVFGLRAERLYDMKGEAGRQLHLSCREVLDRGNHDVEVVGPVLEDEAAAIFPEG